MPGLGILLEHFPVPLVPVIIRGAYEAWPRSQRLPRLKPIEVHILPPLDTARLEREGQGDKPSQRIIDALRAHLARLRASEARRPLAGEPANLWRLSIAP